MRFINSIFGNSDSNQLPNFWKTIKTEEDLENAVLESYQNKVMIFKHSTRCYISKTVLKNFEKEIEKSPDKSNFYYLDLLAYRSISNKIAEDFGIIHQSPQLLVLQNGVVINYASHESITLKLV